VVNVFSRYLWPSVGRRGINRFLAAAPRVWARVGVNPPKIVVGGAGAVNQPENVFNRSHRGVLELRCRLDRDIIKYSS